MMLKFKPTIDPDTRSIEVAIFRNYDMTETTRVYSTLDGWLLVPEGDIIGLTQSEIDSLEEYIPPVMEI